jgi:Domain of unknown function (DUF4105)
MKQYEGHVPGKLVPRRAFFLWLRSFSLISLLLLSEARADKGDSLQIFLQERRARIVQLSGTNEWRALLHYREGWLGSLKSSVDSSNFFLSPVGDISAEAELEATIVKLLDESPAGKSARCRFVARKAFLSQELTGFKERLHRERCEEFEEWRNALTVSQVTLVFIDAFLNNPASLFGHTLLRLDHANDNHLLSYAVQYSAVVNPRDPGLLYAVKGMFGGYKGYFSIAPYYASVSRYSEFELRDIWEYPLDLKENEVRRLVDHMWELQEVAFDYYYFDDNCSALLAELLRAAAPRLVIDSRLASPWKIPIDLLHALSSSAQDDILRDPRYRPSRARRAIYSYALLSQDEQVQAHAVATGSLEVADMLASTQNDASKARILEFAHDQLLLKNEDNATRTYEVLRARSRLPRVVLQKGMEQVLREGRKPPHEAHASRQVSLESGYNSNRGQYFEFGIRPAYHGLLDPAAGLQNGAQIEVLPASVRYYADQDAFRVERFDLIDIISLTPQIAGSSKISWSFRAARERHSLGGGSVGHVGRLDILAGRSLLLGSEGQTFVLAGARGESGDELDVFVAPLVRVGSLLQLSESLKLFAESKLFYNRTLGWEPSLGVAHTVNREWTGVLTVSNESPYGSRATEVGLSLRYFF